MVPLNAVAASAVDDAALPAHESLSVDSAALSEARRGNVYTPPEYATSGHERLPVLNVNVWPGAAPGSENWRQKQVIVPDTPVGTVAINVVTPTLSVYLPAPDKATRTGIIIAPGGYCVALALSAEGTDVAQWLQRQGIAAFVLKYRTMEKRGQGIPKDLDMDAACRFGSADAIESINLVRKHATQWGVGSARIGIIGFSAGGMVASAALLQSNASARPDFAALIYGAPFGVQPHIPARLPPIFMAWAQDDDLARTAMARFYNALVAAGHKPEAHIFRNGGHGFAMQTRGTTSDGWRDELLAWMGSLGLLKNDVK